MQRKHFDQFLAASAAGGARAAMLALIAQEMGGAGQVDISRTLRAANELALAVEPPDQYNQPITFDEGGQFKSVRYTVVTATDCGPEIRVNAAEYGIEMADAPSNHYREVSARGVATFAHHVCGESQWAWLARFAAHMDVLQRREGQACSQGRMVSV